VSCATKSGIPGIRRFPLSLLYHNCHENPGNPGNPENPGNPGNQVFTEFFFKKKLRLYFDF
jgi:hypothetical protein